MNFNSIPFLVLATVTFALYYAPARWAFWQITILITASFVFYGWAQPALLILLLFCALITSLAVRFIALSESIPRQRVIAAFAIAAMLLVLAFFKYDRLIAETFFTDPDKVGGLAHSLLLLPLPIGISFYTFHGISLAVDTFNNKSSLRSLAADRESLPRTLLYLTFFPQLIAGPIMKARDFLPQIEKKSIHAINWESVTRALIAGYFLKLVIADNLAVITNLMTGDVSGAAAITLLAMIFAYSCQIFADFAGYSLIAIGLGRLYGYELMVNFNFPYLSQSFSEFWHRWHISLSTWLRDYLYIPLGGNRQGAIRNAINILIVMFLGGLWHGAAWSYAIWGTVHGLALVAERPFLNRRFYTSNAISLRIIRMLMVFVFVSFAWLLFRLPDFVRVKDYVAALTSNWGRGFGGEVMFAIVFYSLPILIYHALQLSSCKQALMERTKLKTAAFAALLAAIMLNSGEPGAFIYFQF